jgi:hypothetical protein
MPKVVFLTRGHGFGHAARDLQIIESIRASRPDIEVVLASSGTGLRYYRARSVPCEALDIPDHEDMSREAGKRVWQFLKQMGSPDLVVVDEVMWALPICRRLLGVNCVLLTDWFYCDWGLPHLDPFLNQATAIMVPDFQVAHPGLDDITVPKHFTGPLVRRFDVDRQAFRQELGLAQDALAAVVTLGGMPERPAAQAVVDAALRTWSVMASQADRLFVLVDRDPAAGSRQEGSVTWVGITATPERLFGAADVVLADAAGFTVCELARNGIPVVAVASPAMPAMLPTSRLRVEYLQAVGLVTAAEVGVGSEQLWRLMEQARSTSSANGPPGESVQWANPYDMAALLLRYMGQN